MFSSSTTHSEACRNRITGEVVSSFFHNANHAFFHSNKLLGSTTEVSIVNEAMLLCLIYQHKMKRFPQNWSLCVKKWTSQKHCILTETMLWKRIRKYYPIFEHRCVEIDSHFYYTAVCDIINGLQENITSKWWFPDHSVITVITYIISRQ